MTSPLVTLILAGGKSSRMGQDKALLEWQGIPLLRRVATVAETCTDPVFILTPWPERYASLLDPHWILLRERQSGQGPLVGFSQGLQLLKAQLPLESWILLLACDLPRLRSDYLQAWATQLESLPPDQLALVPYVQQRWDPLCAFYRLQVAESLDPFIQSGGRSFQAWLAGIPVTPLAETPGILEMLWNCNTPFDWQDHFQSLAGKIPPSPP